MCTSQIVLLLLSIPLTFSLIPNLRRGLKNIRRKKDVTIDTFEYLAGKTAVITGSSSGLGRAIAIELATCNVKSMVLSGRNIDALELVKTECLKICPELEVYILTCDLANTTSAENFARESSFLLSSGVDLLILSGGCSSRSSFIDTTLDVDKLLMNVNFLSGAAICKVIVPLMVQRQKGNIIWISSIQGLIGTPYRTSYAASKFAVQGYCESMRSELTSSGVKVSCVSPGYIRTNLSKAAITGDGSRYGVTDETTASGADPTDVAIEILNSINTKSDYLIAASFFMKVALFLKFFFPRILEKQLVKRYQNGLKSKGGKS